MLPYLRRLDDFFIEIHYTNLMYLTGFISLGLDDRGFEFLRENISLSFLKFRELGSAMLFKLDPREVEEQIDLDSYDITDEEVRSKRVSMSYKKLDEYVDISTLSEHVLSTIESALYEGYSLEDVLLLCNPSLTESNVDHLFATIDRKYYKALSPDNWEL